MTAYTIKDHEKHLKKLLKNLGDIDEPRKNVDLILREPLWTPNGSKKMEKFPDLILVCRPGMCSSIETGYGVVVELKSNGKAKKDAVRQMINGKIYVETRMRLPVPYGKFVQYAGEKPGFVYEQIPFADFLHNFSGDPDFTSTKKYKIILKDLNNPRIYRRGSTFRDTT